MCHSPAEAYYVNKILKSKYPSTRGWNDFPKTPKPIKHRAKGQYLVQQAHRLFQRQRKLNRELTEQRQMVRNPMGSIIYVGLLKSSGIMVKAGLARVTVNQELKFSRNVKQDLKGVN